MKRILTGDRPTGKLHLGHYVGSLVNRVKLQDEYETFLIVADLHALTTKPSLSDTQQFRDNIFNQVMDYLSVGIDPKKSTIYIQSYIPEVTELYTVFSMLTTVPRLDRMPTLKEVMNNAHITIPSYGLLGYPVLQAADILMVRANLVPVGKDQESHIEITREIARDFNRTYSKVFPEPDALIGEVPSLPGIDGAGKMSKSAGNAINLSDSADEVTKKVMNMYTDPTRIKATDPGHIEGNPLFMYLDAFAPESEKGRVNEFKDRYQQGTVGDVEVKKYLAEVLDNFLDPIRKKRAEYESQPDLVKKIIEQGTQRAREEAQKTLVAAKRAMRVNYFDMADQSEQKPLISIEDFAKIELKVGTVVDCEEIEGSEKLLKLTVDMGEEKPRTVLSGIKQWYSPEDLKGKQFVFVANLEPRKMMGLESQGMIMATDSEKPFPLTPSDEVAPGTKIR